MAESEQSHVYDLLHPSPAPLKDIVAISIAIELWRNEINKYRNINALNRLHFDKTISLDGLTSHIPSTLLSLIQKYSKTVGSSIQEWLDYHYGMMFRFHHNDQNHVLRDFDNFVGDFDGRIDNAKTAKRVILCDRFNDVEKFTIAGYYCFEEDVVSLWPSVSSSVSIEESDVDDNPSLYYWVRRLRFGISGQNEVLMMLEKMDAIPTVIEYSWNSIDSHGRLHVAVKKMVHSRSIEFWRYFLPKLNERELDVFVPAAGDEIISSLSDKPSFMRLLLPVWRLVKSKMTESIFIFWVQTIFEMSSYNLHFDLEDLPLPDLCEIYKTAADNLKRSAIQYVLSSEVKLLERDVSDEYYSLRLIEFLMCILSDTTIEERNGFWNTNWPNLIFEISLTHFHDLINLCIGNQKDIDEFKENQLSRYEIIAPSCKSFLRHAEFQKINEFLKFCCPNEEIRKEIKLRLLYEELELNTSHVQGTVSLDEFIKSTIEDEEKIIEFKNYLSTKLMADSKSNWWMGIMSGEYREIMLFVDTILSKEIALDLKQSFLLPKMQGLLTNGVCAPLLHKFDGDEMSNFLKWCFGDEKKIKPFKLTLPAEEIVRSVTGIMIANSEYGFLARCWRKADLYNFIEWYFTTPEDLAKFKTSLADVFEKIDQLE